MYLFNSLAKSYTLFWNRNIINILPANSASTKYRPFQVKMNWSKFIIDILQQRSQVTFLIFLLVTLGSLFFGAFLPSEIITIYEK